MQEVLLASVPVPLRRPIQTPVLETQVAVATPLSADDIQDLRDNAVPADETPVVASIAPTSELALAEQDATQARVAEEAFAALSTAPRQEAGLSTITPRARPDVSNGPSSQTLALALASSRESNGSNAIRALVEAAGKEIPEVQTPQFAGTPPNPAEAPQTDPGVEQPVQILAGIPVPVRNPRKLPGDGEARQIAAAVSQAEPVSEFVTASVSEPRNSGFVGKWALAADRGMLHSVELAAPAYGSNVMRRNDALAAKGVFNAAPQPYVPGRLSAIFTGSIGSRQSN
jgi:hypothetical protein